MYDDYYNWAFFLVIDIGTKHRLVAFKRPLIFVKKANSTRAFLARNIPRCCRKVKQMAYTTYIRPTVEYASPVWDPHTKRNTNKIEMVQRRCARYVTGNFDRTSSVTSMLNCLSWPTLEERRCQYRLAVMYRILHNQVDIH